MRPMRITVVAVTLLCVCMCVGADTIHTQADNVPDDQWGRAIETAKLELSRLRAQLETARPEIVRAVAKRKDKDIAYHAAKAETAKALAHLDKKKAHTAAAREAAHKAYEEWRNYINTTVAALDKTYKATEAQKPASNAPKQDVDAFNAKLARDKKALEDAKAVGAKHHQTHSDLLHAARVAEQNETQAKDGYLQATDNERKAHGTFAEAVLHKNRMIRRKNDLKNVIKDVRRRMFNAHHTRVRVYKEHEQDWERRVSQKSAVVTQAVNTRSSKASGVHALRQQLHDARAKLATANTASKTATDQSTQAQSNLQVGKARTADAQTRRDRTQQSLDDFNKNQQST